MTICVRLTIVVTARLCCAAAVLAAPVPLSGQVVDPDPIRVDTRIIADTSTSVPLSSGAFAEFGAPATDGSNIAFVGARTGLRGVYRWDGSQLVRVADTTQPVPGTTQTFTHFWTTDVVSGQVFFAASATGGTGGVYRFAGGSLQPLVDGSAPLPGQSGALGLFYVSAGGSLVVASKPSPPSAIYRMSPAPLETIALDGDPMPGGGVFELVAVGPHRTDGVGTVFMAGQAGSAWPRVILSQGGALTLIAGPGTPVPGGTIAELDFTSTPLLVDGQVYFSAKPADRPYRLYRWANGVITEVAQGLAISAPADVGALGFLDNGAFVTLRNGRLLVETDDQFAELLGPFSSVAGRSVDEFDCGSEAVGGDSVVCSVLFDNGSAGIVRMSVELPSAGGGGGGGGAVDPVTLLLVAFLSVALHCRRQGRSGYRCQVKRP